MKISKDQIRKIVEKTIEEMEKMSEKQVIEIPKSNLVINKIAMDANGNKTLYLSTFSGKRKKIQTNGNLPYIHSKFGKTDFDKIIEDPKAIKEIKDYLSEYDSKDVKFY
jgi:hypothetical protein